MIRLLGVNKGNPTHFHVQTGSFSCIDLSIASPDALMDFDWSVLDDLHGSDHFPIIISYGDSVPISRASRWCTERANWTLFKELSHIDLDYNELPTIEEAVYYLNSIYINAVNSLFLRLLVDSIANLFLGGTYSAA